MKIAVFVGSLRKKSINRSVFEAYREIAGGAAEFIDIAYGEMPHYDEDLRGEGGAFPKAVRKWADQVRSADAVLVISPEYNYSVPGSLKNALDWLSRDPSIFAGKPASIISASPGKLGGARMQYHLRQIGVFLDLHFMNKPEVVISEASKKLSPTGEFTDEETRKFLKTHFEKFVQFAKRR